ncbi:hypothetical protein MKZ38_008468 [Zalerion maritima]|uniref:Nuclear condensin complex subunit 3 C-terminal domain-containing protein n=1 Tax=Zalerion maritima TaxID=339359 RepID=A0AAD5WVJ8_9PEZI|nr:hypothetical protein MKZ38_008468 [Zalerion maritima]
MPARAPRSTRTSAVSNKSSTSGAPSVAIDVPTEAPDNDLRPHIVNVFRDAQRTTASHRKLVVSLRKVQEACCYEPTSNKKSSIGDFEEDEFNLEFTRCVLRVMPVKKSESVGEKTVRFIGLFLRYAIEKDNEYLGEEDQDASTMPETPSMRLTNYLMETVLPLLQSKDKFVRYRSTQLISHIINSLDAIDDDLFQKLRQGLLKRIRDKEAMVRSQAVLGLGRLAGNQIEGAGDTEGSDEDASSGLLEKLLEVLQNDPSADVRRSLLVNLPILPNTLPYLLERARDQDAMTRRAVYARLLPALGDFRHLSLNMREKLLRWGLRDRDENVRKAAGRLFRERWIEDCAGIPEMTEDGKALEIAEPSMDGLLELLERIDVVNSGVENGVAIEAMKGFWEGRPDYREFVTFDDAFWQTLSAEAVFLARSYNDFCRNDGSGNYLGLVEEKLPEVTKLGFYLEAYIKALIETIKRNEANDNGGEEEEEEDTVEQEFIVEQLLHIALTLDYSDEVGRRKMFALLRQSLSIPELPDEITKLTVNVLRDICAPDIAGEREFCSVVLEAVADVHDTIVDDDPVDDPEESFHSARSEISGDSTPTKNGRGKSKEPELSEEEARAKALKEILINLKCLNIVQCMLTNVGGNLKENESLVSMLNNLVVPAVRSHETPVRERGLVCLGLCALLDRSLAEENLTLFIHFYAKGHSALQITALQILTDILNVHGAQLLSGNPTLLKVYIKALRSGSKNPEVQAAATTAVCKLLLGRAVTDPEACADLLRTLVVSYFDPISSENQGVRQALNYFLPVFCYSRLENQDLMRSIALDTLHSLYNIREGLEEEDVDTDDMITLAAIGACLVDWTDPRKCFIPGLPLDAEKKKDVNGDVHLDLLMDILSKLRGNVNKEEKKAIVSLFSKLYISPSSSEEKMNEAYDDISSAVEEKLLTDVTGRNAILKIHTALGKIHNSLQEAAEGRMGTMSRSASVASNIPSDADTSGVSGSSDKDRTVVPEPDIKEEEEEDEGMPDANTSAGTVVRREYDGNVTEKGNESNIVDELLSDDD